MSNVSLKQSFKLLCMSFCDVLLWEWFVLWGVKLQRYIFRDIWWKLSFVFVFALQHVQKARKRLTFFCLHVGICSDIIAWQVLLLLKLENPQAISQCVSDYVCIINWFQFSLIQNHISLNFTSTFLQLPLHHPEWWMVFVHASFSKAVRSIESSEVCIVALRDRCRFVLQRRTEKLHDCIAAKERGSFLPWVSKLW